MADENNDGTGSEFDLDGVLTQAKEAGVTLMTQDAFDKRFAKERAKHDALQADLAAVKSQYEETHGELQKYLDKGKTDDQRRAEETLKLEKRAKAYQEQYAQEQARSAQLQQAIKDRDLERHLFDTIGAKAANPRRAVLIARTELSGVDLDENGQLVYTDENEIPHTGDEAKQKIAAWFDNQPDLHRAGGSGPPASNPKPNGANTTRPYADLTDEERFARLHGG